MARFKRKAISPIADQVKGSGRLAHTDGRASRCYRWEDSNADLLKSHKSADKALPRDVAKGLARLMVKVALRRMAEKHNLTAAQVDKIRAGFKARFVKEAGPFCLGGINGAYWTEWGWSPGIIAHEVAHWADHNEAAVLRESGARTGHGPQWLGWYVFLLADVVKVPMADMERTLKAARLRFTLP